MLKLFAHPMSTCSRKVLCALAETNTPFELVVVDFAKGEHKAPAHLARQPFGQIPALDDDGFGLFESRAIMRYLAEKAGSTLLPKDLRGRALAEQWLSVETSNFTPPAMKLVWEYVFNPMFGKPADQAKIDEGTANLMNVLPILDAHLATHTFMAGDTFTVADIGYLPYIDYLMPTPAKALFAQFPNFMAWWNRASERPSWRAAVGRA